MLRILSAAAGALSVFLLVMGVALANFEVLRPMTGMVLFALGGILGLAGVLLAAGVLFRSGFVTEAIVGFWGAGPLVLLLTASVNALLYPAINDITTDLDDPPRFEHAATLPENAGRTMDFPAANAAVIRASYPFVAPMELSLGADATFQRVEGCARSMPGWEITVADPKSRVIEGVAVTTFMRWRDDFIIRVRETPAQGSRIDMRSKSREGRSDLGTNGRRIRTFYNLIVESLTSP